MGLSIPKGGGEGFKQHNKEDTSAAATEQPQQQQAQAQQQQGNGRVAGAAPRIPSGVPPGTATQMQQLQDGAAGAFAAANME